MPRYMVQAAYTAEAAASFARTPQDRAGGVRALLERMGGKLESFDYSMGEFDVVIVFSVPDDVTATAVALAAISPGHLKAYRTTKLLSPEEFLEASRKASGVTFQGPS